MKKVYALPVLFCFLLLLSDCDKKKDVIADLPSATITIDGASKTIVPASGILSFETQNSHEGRALDLTFTIEGNVFSVAFSNWDFQSPPDNGIKVKTYTAELANGNTSECLELGDGITTLCEGTLVSYLVGTTTLYMSGFYSGDYEGSTTISACDTSRKVVSGSFDLKLSDIDGTHTLLVKGTFKNIKYTVDK